MNQLENTKRAARRRACTHTLASSQRRAPAIAGERRQRSARSEARAADALINAYARDVATARASRQTVA